MLVRNLQTKAEFMMPYDEAMKFFKNDLYEVIGTEEEISKMSAEKELTLIESRLLG